jgi:hypothetical protein
LVTAPGNGLCPFGYGQFVNATASPFGATINGNGLSIYRNPSTGAKTLVVVFSAMNSDVNTHNALKIGISNTGSAIYNEANAKLFLNRLAFDGARFLNPERPGDLYITTFMFNANFVKYGSTLPPVHYCNTLCMYGSRVDPKVGVQVVQFTPEQLDAASAVPRTTVFPTSKYCSLSAGQLSDPSSVQAGSVPAFSPTTMMLKIYNSADCNPATSERVIAVPFTANACNMYSAAASSRFFKIRCLSGEGFNGIHASTKYFFQDYSSLSACDASSPAEPITSTSGVNATVTLLSSGRQAEHAI